MGKENIDPKQQNPEEEQLIKKEDYDSLAMITAVTACEFVLDGDFV